MKATLSRPEAARLALARAGLLKPEWTGLPIRAGRDRKAQERSCHAILRRFGYLQLDTISVAGARSHVIVLLSRLDDLAPDVPERLLRPRAPLFEYWGHEASWIPLELYPVFGFRRDQFRKKDPWWGAFAHEHRNEVRKIMRRIRDEGPLRSADFEDTTARNDWGFNRTRKLLRCLWSASDLAIRERRRFQRYYDLTERVVPARLRGASVPEPEALKALILKALDGHGWAETRTIAATWRLKNRSALIRDCLRELAADGAVVECALAGDDGEARTGWIRAEDLELAARLRRARPPADAGVLLSPFDPLLWDRDRVRLLFGFDQVLEVFKPARKRRFGYYSMPVLAGDRLVARCDLKADRPAGRLDVLSTHYEEPGVPVRRAAVERALDRYAGQLGVDHRVR